MQLIYELSCNSCNKIFSEKCIDERNVLCQAENEGWDLIRDVFGKHFCPECVKNGKDKEE